MEISNHVKEYIAKVIKDSMDIFLQLQLFSLISTFSALNSPLASKVVLELLGRCQKSMVLSSFRIRVPVSRKPL